jgi:hypothetical protein
MWMVFVLSKEAISRFLPNKDLLTLDLKYYEKNSMQMYYLFIGKPFFFVTYHIKYVSIFNSANKFYAIHNIK